MSEFQVSTAGVSRELANRSHAGTSWDPEKRDDYAKYLHGVGGIMSREIENITASFRKARIEGIDAMDGAIATGN